MIVCSSSRSSLFSRSILFNMIIRLCPSVASSSFLSSSVNASLWLNTKSTRSASVNALRLRSTPIRSTISSVSRIPAVSINRKGTPLTLTYSSITSRVVPATSVTMAFSSLRSTFSKLDLPTFGRPIIAVANPSRKIFPCPAVSSNASTCPFTSLAFSTNNLDVISSTSSYSG